MTLSRGIRNSRRIWEMILFSLGLFIFGAAIVYMVNKVNQELGMLSLAHSDVVQWNLSQLEIENASLVEELLRANASDTVSKADILTKFDILYSRIDTIETSPLYTELRANPDMAHSLSEVRAYLDEWAPILDDPQTTVHDLFPDFLQATTAVQQPIRREAVNAVAYFADQQVKHRGALSYTLLGILLLSCVLFVVLLFMIRVLDKLNRENRVRAKQIEQDRAHMDAIVSSSLDAIVVADADGVITEFKGAASQIFGYAKEDVLDTHISRLIHMPDPKKTGTTSPHGSLSVLLSEIIGQGRVRAEGRRKCGAYFAAEVAVETAKSQGSRVLVVFIRDISKESEAEKKLLSARDSAVAGERSKSQLLAVMSHEIRTPLNGLIGSMELLRQTDLTEAQQEYLRMMSHSGSLLLSHVNNVLDISRLEAGQMDLQRKVFNLLDLIDEIVKGQQVLASERHNTIVFPHEQGDMVLVESDRLRLGQVLLNIISNANKFTESGEIRVEIEAAEHRSMVEIRIADTGIGIADDQISRIFQDFATGDASFTRRTEGTGLGLGIARRIARAMGGDIHVVSELGEGSIFTVRLPIAALDADECEGQIQSPGAETGSAQTRQPRLKVLVVEDNEINRLVVSKFLTKDGHHVVEAVDGYEGITAASREVFDLILMDISMPSLDGTQVTKIIRSGDGLNAKTPITAVTAHAMDEDIRLFIASGMNEVLVKPLTQLALRAMIAKVHAHVTPTVAETMLNGSVIDADVVRQFHAEIGPVAFDNLTRKFVLEMGEMLPLLTQESDIICRSRIAHKLAGSAAIFGASQMVERLRAVELACKSGNEQLAQDLTADALTVWTAAQSELEALYTQLKAS